MQVQKRGKVSWQGPERDGDNMPGDPALSYGVQVQERGKVSGQGTECDGYNMSGDTALSYRLWQVKLTYYSLIDTDKQRELNAL